MPRFFKSIDGRDFLQCGPKELTALAGEHRLAPIAIAPPVPSAQASAWCQATGVMAHDTIEQQLREWARTQSPAGSESEHRRIIDEEIKAVSDLIHYGRWFYYPWRRALTHLLPEDRFHSVRTNRNRNKIALAQQQYLRTKRIGVVGLSVGHAAALTVAQEGLCGEMRLADFDTIDMSNLNRLRTSVLNIGEPKTLIAARDIAELDPYLPVKSFSEGITEDNIERFLLEDGKLDLLIEECDAWHIKIKLREVARAHGIPVVMATDDRGLIDIERFDRDRTYPLLHGLLGGLTYEGAKQASARDRIALLYTFLGGDDQGSPLLRESLQQVGRELVSFPQLATDVHLSAALVADAARKVLLNQIESGRYRVDLDAIIHDPTPNIKK